MRAAVALVAIVLIGTSLPDDGPANPAAARDGQGATVVNKEPVDSAVDSASSDDAAGTNRASESPDVAVEATRRSGSPTTTRTVPLLRAADGGDGDSWRDTTGRHYRLGLVNAPESSACFGAAATQKRRALVADGFRADVYARDRHGRLVAEVKTPSGLSVNQYLARHGFADDRYLEEFRAENPGLGARLDRAFASAKAERAGLWGRCSGGTAVQGFAAPAPTKSPSDAPGAGCHPDYVTCIPIKGDGSGAGAANDLDCGEVRRKVTLRRVGVDPYRLDANNDGLGCESYG